MPTTPANAPRTYTLTTAIDYANGSPHLGHAYEKVLADCIARHRALLGDAVFFLTGLDEHGQKVQQTAEKLGVRPQILCDEIAEKFQGMCTQLNISHNDYIRTTQPRHKRAVQHALQTLFNKGEIYKAKYEGFYSPRIEQFVQEKDRLEDGSWPADYGEVQTVEEENYFFKLSAYQPWLVDFLNDEKHPENKDFIYPAYRKKQVQEFLKDPMNDLCISRPKARLSWGIELPFDGEYVTYVWFDALLNYITALGYAQAEDGGNLAEFEARWPVNAHVIGKDILSPPHAVYWPIMLKALGLKMPQRIIAHGWWQLRGEKMSKSTGNVLNPLELAEKFGTDAFRYFVMREMHVGADADFSEIRFLERYTSELANDLGNLLNRVLNMTQRYTAGTLPAPAPEAGEPEAALQAAWAAAIPSVQKHFEGLEFSKGLEALFAAIKDINKYAETRAPWKLAKTAADNEADKALLETSLAHMAEGLRLAACLLTPVMPTTSARILQLLGSSPCELWEAHTLSWGTSLNGATVGTKEILFPRPE